MTADGGGAMRSGVSIGRREGLGAVNIEADRIVDMGAYELQGVGEAIPTAFEWGLYTMTLLTPTAGTIAFGRRCAPFRWQH